MQGLRWTGLIAAAVGLCAACGGAKVDSALHLRPDEVTPPPYIDPRFERTVVSFDALPGWGASDYAAALHAFADTCAAFTPEDPRKDEFLPVPHARWAVRCREAVALSLAGADSQTAQAYFESAFHPVRLTAGDGSEGLVTGYYEPIIDARVNPGGPFNEPLLGRPRDLVVEPATPDTPTRVFQRLSNGATRPYPTRAQIMSRPPANVLAWGRRSDVLFLQIQGSGRLRYRDGTVRRAAFDASNGRPYVSVAQELMRMGLLPAGVASNAGVKRWLDSVGPEAASAVIARNPRYVFFRLEAVQNEHQGGRGAAGTPLHAGASLAVDPQYHRYGGLFWIAPEGPSAPAPQMAVAQDTGAAIEGPLRGDIFFGVGGPAGDRASRVRHVTTWYALAPSRDDDGRES